jgi:hypothetical protein
MKEIEFNKDGVPLLAFGKSYFASTTGAPSNANKKIFVPTDNDTDTVTVGDMKIVDWGTNNKFPHDAINIIRKNGVLNSGLRFIRNFTLGQGIFPVIVNGYDDNGKEDLKVVDDPKLRRFVNGRIARNYLMIAARDYLKTGISPVQLIPSNDGKSLAGIKAINTLYCRFAQNETGSINKAVVSGMWPDTPSEGKYKTYDVLDDYDPHSDIYGRKLTGKLKGNLLYVIRDSWASEDYYSFPGWYSAYLAGWVDISSSVPTFLKKAYENQVSWKWHIQIPYAYWDKKFPKEDYETTEERKTAIEGYMDDIEDNICGQANANKPIFTFFEMNASGKAEEQWIIKPLENKYKDDDKLFTSAAANSEIMFSMLLNPNIMGAGMPGGTYAGNQGGSNIREAYLVNLANSWLDRQELLEPLEIYLRANGVDENIELRFKNTVLTTLDSGAGTQKILS